MKSLLFLLATFGIANFAMAQTVKFGIKAGVNVSEITNTKIDLNGFSSNSPMQKMSSMTNFNVGGFVDIRYKNFSIQPGLSYITKGGTKNYSTSSTQSTEKLTFHYIEIPVNLLVNLPVGKGEIFIGGGPYLDMGLSGNYKFTHTALGTTTNINSEIAFGNTPYMLYGDEAQGGEVKNPAFGINALAGFKLSNGFLISAGYGFNLTQIANNNDQTAKINSAIFSLGYFFK